MQAQSLTVNGNLSNSGTLTIESEYSNEDPSGLTLNGSLIVIGTSTGDVTYNRSLRPKDTPETAISSLLRLVARQLRDLPQQTAVKFIS